MDDRWSVGSVHDDQLKEIAGPIRPDEQIPGRVLVNLFDHSGQANGVLDVLIGDSVSSG